MIASKRPDTARAQVPPTGGGEGIFSFRSGPAETPPQDFMLRMALDAIAAEPDLNASRAPLMALYHVPEQESGRERFVFGTFVQRDGALYFSPTRDGCRMEAVPCSDLLSGVGELADYFIDHDLTAVLRGRIRDRAFLVSELHSAGSSRAAELQGLGRPIDANDQAVSDGVIQAVVSRIRFDEGQLQDEEAFRRGCPLSQEKELRLLRSVVGARLSQGQQEWVDRELARLTAPGLSRDDKSQILRALTCVLNIGWSGRPVQLAPYDSVRERLDQRFYGIEPVKTRILEVIAQIRRCGHLPQWGILLNGPAGVGKTSVALEIARALGRRLVTVDLSTTVDADGLVGSPRIYSNARPGAIAEKLLANRDSNCVMLLNELDKAAKDKRGGCPADALLTLVDKLGFIDNFLETSIPTDNIFFIATCNDIDQVSKPLQDRFLRIDIDGYTMAEKQTIFTRHVLPKTLAASNVGRREVRVTDEFTRQLCRHHAREPGVRDLEQCAERLVGDFLLRAERDGISSRTYGGNDVEALFGRRRQLRRAVAHRPGQAEGLACGGGRAHAFMVQAACARGGGGLQVLGAVTELQRDQCRVAYECVRELMRVDLLGVDVSLCITSALPPTPRNFLGCAAFMAIASALTRRALPPNALCLGGCGLLGDLFWDDAELTGVLSYLEAGEDKVLYGPVGLAELAGGAGRLAIVEAVSADLLFEAAVG